MYLNFFKQHPIYFLKKASPPLVILLFIITKLLQASHNAINNQ